MNSNFKFKLLSHLTAKKENKGFTLIELLVVVIIIGVLAAIALPNLLGQVGKARESEAKSTIGALNRAQQAYFTEKSDFATDTAGLEVPAPQGKYYSFSTGPQTAGSLASSIATALDANKDGTRSYTGGTQYYSADRSFTTVVCRADLATAGTAPTLTAGAASGDAPTCSGGEAVK